MDTRQERARDVLHALSDEELIQAFVQETSRRAALGPVRDDVTALLTMSPALERLRRSAVANPAAAAAARNRVVADATHALVDRYEMFDSVTVSRVLGKAAASRNTASRLAESGTVIALPVGNKKLYPAFQFDPERNRVRPLVAEVNQRLDAKGDPWGVASWWLSPTDMADDPRSPAELAATGVDDDDVRDMAEDVTAP